MSDDSYTYHLGVYSKLLRGRTSKGPIMPSAEARIVSRSRGWEIDANRTTDRMDGLCDPQIHFSNRPMLMAMDARLMPGGAFVYRPYMRGNGSRHYGVFSRIEARSEAGEGKPGRNYTHCASLIVENHWEPNLIEWAARMLFDPEQRDDENFPWGDPISEHHGTRSERRLHELRRSELANQDVTVDVPNWPLRRQEGGAWILHAAMPELTEGERPQIRLAQALASVLTDLDLRVHGRWLSIALGVSTNADAPGPGFAIRLDDRNLDDVGAEVLIPFSDEDPPVLTISTLEAATDEAIGSDRVYGVNWKRLRSRIAIGRGTRVLFSDAQLWPDQLHARPEAALPTASPRIGPNAGDPGEFDDGRPRHRNHGGADLESVDPHSPGARGRPAPTARPALSPSQVRERPSQRYERSHDLEAAQIEERTHERHYRRENTASEMYQEDDVLEALPTDSRFATSLEPDLGLRIDPALRIEWPPIPDETHRWVYDESLLPRLRKRFEVLITLVGLLDEGDFSEFKLWGSEELYNCFAAAFAFTARILAVYSLTGDPRQLSPVLETLLSHREVPALGLRPARAGSLLCQMFVILLRNGVGLENLHRYIDRQGRIARDIAALWSDRRTHLTAPERGHLEELLARLETGDGVSVEIPTSDTPIGKEFELVAKLVLSRASSMLSSTFQTAT